MCEIALLARRASGCLIDLLARRSSGCLIDRVGQPPSEEVVLVCVVRGGVFGGGMQGSSRSRAARVLRGAEARQNANGRHAKANGRGSAVARAHRVMMVHLVAQAHLNLVGNQKKHWMPQKH